MSAEPDNLPERGETLRTHKGFYGKNRSRLRKWLPLIKIILNNEDMCQFNTGVLSSFPTMQRYWIAAATSRKSHTVHKFRCHSATLTQWWHHNLGHQKTSEESDFTPEGKTTQTNVSKCRKFPYMANVNKAFLCALCDNVFIHLSLNNTLLTFSTFQARFLLHLFNAQIKALLR